MFFTILAVVMQSVRTAGQKQMAQSLTAEATTLVRFLFGLPFALIYFSLLWRTNSGQEVVLSASYWLPASLATVSQIVATLCLVKALTLRNFAVGTALAKTEAIMTALLGSLFFAASLSVLGYVSVYVGVIGVLVASNWRISVPDLMNNASIKYGLGAGLGFALASLWIRQASLSLAVPELLSAATGAGIHGGITNADLSRAHLLQATRSVHPDRQQLAFGTIYWLYQCCRIHWLVYRHEPAGGRAGEDPWAKPSLLLPCLLPISISERRSHCGSISVWA
jgi:uncharacterized membrane protein